MGEIHLGVIDRFEGDDAVVLLESDGDVVDELVLPQAEIPKAGRHDDAVLEIEREGDMVTAVSYAEAKTERREGHAAERFRELSKRPPSSDDEDKQP